MLCRLRAANKAQGDGTKRVRHRERARAGPAPDANAELQANIDVCLYDKSPALLWFSYKFVFLFTMFITSLSFVLFLSSPRKFEKIEPSFHINCQLSRFEKVVVLEI